ncbi:glutamate 5-kinase [Suhomyces tanzawaensis NRRL Y-17324]|uniref:Glutamate 5-kinase n=1 Tax=Suhomyces tanzawaensis NRRL Y-17324 TaxID=984487 RepID=A0A1E4SJ71_9ASCO|nr:glutamate 5-kinase [Suhomyces tanzawaensis NRRL Y-17324]ODV79553.1 glutamate 5-kinase [Suhomyces tanzawaensis NRRL Y-17324]
MKNYTIVIKLGTSSLVDEVTREPRIANMSLIVETIVNLKRQGHRIVLVSSGAIAFGMKRMGLQKKPGKLAAVQALAAIGQSRLMGLFEDLFRQLDVHTAQILITRNDIIDFTQYKNATNTLNELLEMGVVPIVNENDTLSVAEIKFGDNDTLSAITAGMMHADYLFLMTDVECLYTDNPRTNPDAKPILIVDKIDELAVKTDTETGAGSQVGTGGMTTKLIAAELATNVGVTTIITLSSKPQSILSVVANIQASEEANLTTSEKEELLLKDIAQNKVPLHTRFLGLPTHTQIKSDRRFWLLHGLKTKGSLIIDQGCFEALTRKNRAGLLPAGVIEVEGNFHESECVSIKVVPTKNSDISEAVQVGHCRVNYSSVEINLIKGLKSKDIEPTLGFADSEYIAHRDNLAFPPVRPASTDNLASLN